MYWLIITVSDIKSNNPNGFHFALGSILSTILPTTLAPNSSNHSLACTKARSRRSLENNPICSNKRSDRKTNADEQRNNRYGVKQMIYWRKTNDTQLVALSAKKGLKEAIWPDIYTFRSYLR